VGLAAGRVLLGDDVGKMNRTLPRGPRLSAKQREKRRRRAAGLSWAVRVLGLGAGVGRVRGEGRRKSRPGGVRGAGPRPGSQGLSLFFSNFFSVLFYFFQSLFRKDFEDN
jgi:hypothetical protein